MNMGFFRRNIGKIIAVLFGVVFVGLVIFSGLVLTRNISVNNSEVTYKRQTEVLKFDVPSNGETAIGTLKHGVKFVNSGNTQRPIASMAKVITALVVLNEKPLPNDEVFIVTARDVERYSRETVRNGSRLHVVEGEEITERQAIEAIMLVSANNIADSLVRWVFEDFDTYKVAAEKWLSDHGLENTTIGTDASGFDASTTSTPSDMIEIGRLALQNEALREIFLQQSAIFPFVGKENNTNQLLTDGFIGIKTGNSDQALSCLLFAREYGDDIIIGVMMGQPFDSTFDSARKIWASVDQNFEKITIPANTIVGKYNLPWGGEVEVVTAEEISSITWSDAQPEISLEPISLDTNHKSNIGTLTIGDQITTLRINNVLTGPSIIWRLSNFNDFI